jgi:lipopolysaccharide transport system permease protein
LARGEFGFPASPAVSSALPPPSLSPAAAGPLRAGDAAELETVIEGGRSEAHYWRDLWRFRELALILALRDIKIRYQQTLLGVAWAAIQPAITVSIFTFVFGYLAKMPAGGLPYVLVVFSGQLGWQLFANALSTVAVSLGNSAHLLTKVYFPRLVVPLSGLGVAVIDFFIVLALFAVVSGWFGYWPQARWLVLPLFGLLALALALGAGLWLAAGSVRYRDFRILTPFLIQLGVFVTPVGYRTDFLPNWQLLLSLNPMTGVIEGFRWALLPGAELQVRPVLTALGWAVVLLTSGLWYFRRTERQIADII